ncbi:MAG: F0F1 ATP synthase subunit delta [Clostridia bacterium]
MKTGVLWSALPLEDRQQADIAQRFSLLLGQPVQLAFRLDSTLLGGIRVEIEGRTYDGSLRNQLQSVLRALQKDEEGDAHA